MHRIKIYQSKRHVIVTALFIVIPFVFLLLFAQLSNIASAKLAIDVSSSLTRIALAYFVAAFLGWFFAVLFYKGKRAIIALPIFDVLQSFPTFAALPIATMIWGPNNFTIIFFLVLAIIWPVFFSVISSMKLIKREWEEAVEVYQLSKIDYLRKFLLPVSIPGLITGSIVGMGDGWEALIATEIIVGIKTGLGSFFQFFSANTNMTALGILGFLLIIFTINKLIWLPLLNWGHQKMEE